MSAFRRSPVPDRSSHGDPLPLPVPVAGQFYDPRTLPHWIRKSLVGCRQRERRAANCIRALNDLASSRVGGNVEHSPSANLDPSASQRSCIRHIREVEASCGSRPVGLSDRASLLNLYKTKDLYDVAPATVVPFSSGRLKCLTLATPPKAVRSVAPLEVREVYDNPDVFLRRSQRELDLDERPSIYPYWDEELRNDRLLRRDLFAKLQAVGLIGYRRAIRSTVGMFFVRKSTPGQIRLVIDARAANRCHRDPPHVSLGSAAALSEQNWSPEAINFADEHYVGDGTAWGATIDLSDSFYHF
jgi:hypothetical protein